MHNVALKDLPQACVCVRACTRVDVWIQMHAHMYVYTTQMCTQRRCIHNSNIYTCTRYKISLDTAFTMNCMMEP